MIDPKELRTMNTEVAPEAKQIWQMEIIGYVNPADYSLRESEILRGVVMSKEKTEYYSQPVWRVK